MLKRFVLVVPYSGECCNETHADVRVIRAENLTAALERLEKLEKQNERKRRDVGDSYAIPIR